MLERVPLVRGIAWMAVLSLLLTGPVAGQAHAWRPAGTAGPQARHSHALAYDTQRRVTVLFGGFDGSPQSGSLLGDTWEWDGTTWRKATDIGPSRRLGHAMVHDEKRQVTVLFGGNAGAYCGDTWEWDGSSWRQVASKGPSPRGRHAMAYDSARGVTVLFGGAPRGGGETWEWDGVVWKQVSLTGPWPRARHAMAYDPSRRITWLFGGRDETNRLGDDTWKWKGGSWNQVMTTGPAARSRHAMAHDIPRGVTVLFGGNRGPYLDDTWEWDGLRWVPSIASGPSRRQYHAMAFDRARGVMVLFGGWNGSVALGDTWDYGPVVRLAADGSPRPAGTVRLDLVAASDAGLPFQLGSSLGTGPILVDTRKIHLQPDPLFHVSIGDLWPSVFSGYRGVLDSKGLARAEVLVPDHQALIGMNLHTAFVTLDALAPSGMRSISNTATVRITK